MHPRLALGAPHLGAVDAPEGRLDLREAMVDDRLVAVEREAHAPASDLELARHLVDDRVGHRPLLLPPLVAVGEDRAQQHGVDDLRDHSDRPVEHQPAQDVDHRREVVVLPHPQPQRHVDLGIGHQPDAHLGDDPVVGLHEELVGRRPEAALVDVPGLVVGHRAHAGAHDVAVGQHDLHPALHAHVQPVGQVGRAVVERVADHAPPAEVCAGEHQVVATGLERLVEVEPAHARLDDRVAELLVDLEHAVHVAQAHDHRAAHARGRAAVAVVAAGAVRPQRDALLVGDPHDRLDLLDRRGHDDRRRRVVVRRGVLERIAELVQVRVGREHLVHAERDREGVDRARELRFGETRRQRSGRDGVGLAHDPLLVVEGRTYSTRVNQVTTIGSSSVSRQPGSPSSSATSSRQAS
jgi:hypothetical protein